MSRISKIIKEKRNGRQHFSSPPLVVPVGAVVPETANQTMARLMLTSGVISRDDYEKMLGVRYDIDNDEGVNFDEEDYGDYKDDYELSVWSEYEREVIDVGDNPSVVSSSNLDTDGHIRTNNSDSGTNNPGTVDGKEKNIEGSASAETNSTAS